MCYLKEKTFGVPGLGSNPASSAGHSESSQVKSTGTIIFSGRGWTKNLGGVK